MITLKDKNGKDIVIKVGDVVTIDLANHTACFYSVGRHKIFLQHGDDKIYLSEKDIRQTWKSYAYLICGLAGYSFKIDEETDYLVKLVFTDKE